MDSSVQKYRNLLTSNGFDEIIRNYTREEIIIDNLVKSCLDHIFVRSTDTGHEGIIIKNKISDHYT